MRPGSSVCRFFPHSLLGLICVAPRRYNKVGAGIVGPGSLLLAASLFTVGGEHEVFTDSSLSLAHSRRLPARGEGATLGAAW